jgi:hypothetical protein
MVEVVIAMPVNIRFPTVFKIYFPIDSSASSATFLVNNFPAFVINTSATTFYSVSLVPVAITFPNDYPVAPVNSISCGTS